MELSLPSPSRPQVHDIACLNRSLDCWGQDDFLSLKHRLRQLLPTTPASVVNCQKSSLSKLGGGRDVQTSVTFLGVSEEVKAISSLVSQIMVEKAYIEEFHQGFEAAG